MTGLYPRSKSLSTSDRPCSTVKNKINQLNNRPKSIIFPCYTNYTNIENNNKLMNNIKPMAPPASMVFENTIPSAPPINNNLLHNNNQCNLMNNSVIHNTNTRCI